MDGLPYLDALTCEVLRLHPGAPEWTREVYLPFHFPAFSLFDGFFFELCCAFIPGQAIQDDTIPLTHPIRTASGNFVDKIFVTKGTFLRIPIAGVNRSEALWGPDAAKFDPGRWLVSNGETKSAMGRMEEVKGYRNLLTFGNGSRTCLGKNFALLEFKVRGSFSSLFICGRLLR